MRYRFIDDHRARWTVLAMTSALHVTRQGYYAWKKRPASATSQRRGKLTERVRKIFTESNHTYGSPRITRALRNEGQRVTTKTVERIMTISAHNGFVEDTGTGTESATTFVRGSADRSGVVERFHGVAVPQR